LNRVFIERYLMNHNIGDELIKLVRKYSESSEDVTNETDLITHLGYDSFDFVSLVIAIERKFAIEFELEDMDLNSIRNFQNLLNVVERYIKY